MNAPIANPLPPYHHTPLFPLGPDKTPYRKLEVGGVRVEKVMGKATHGPPLPPRPRRLSPGALSTPCRTS